jgi:hypothetical protein
MKLWKLNHKRTSVLQNNRLINLKADGSVLWIYMLSLNLRPDLGVLVNRDPDPDLDSGSWSTFLITKKILKVHN